MLLVRYVICLETFSTGKREAALEKLFRAQDSAFLYAQVKSLVNPRSFATLGGFRNVLKPISIRDVDKMGSESSELVLIKIVGVLFLITIPDSIAL